MMHLAPQQIVTSRVPIKGPARTIIEWVAKRYGVKVSSILGPRRKKRATHARMVAINLIFRHPKCRHLSLVKIGKIFGRHWATIINALKKFHSPERYAIEMLYRKGQFNRSCPSNPPRDEQALLRRQLAREKGRAASALRNAARLERMTPEIFMLRVGVGMNVEEIERRHVTSGETIRRIVGDVLVRASRGDAAAVQLVEKATGRDANQALPDLFKRFKSLPAVKELLS